MELRERFESAFEATPETRTPHRPLDDRLRAGRSTVRRRRAAGVAGGLAVTAVVGGIAWSLAEAEPDPTVVEAPYASEPGAPHDPDWPVVEDPKATDFMITPEGEIGVPPGTRFIETISDPISEADSIAFEAAVPGASGTMFVLADRRRGLLLQSDEAGEYYTTLAAWAEDAAAPSTGGPLEGLVAVDADGRLVATDPAVEIVDQQVDPEIGPEFAGPAERTVAAEILVEGGVTWFVYGHFLPDHLEHAQLYRVEPTVLEKRTVQGLVDHVNARLAAEVAAEGDR